MSDFKPLFDAYEQWKLDNPDYVRALELIEAYERMAETYMNIYDKYAEAKRIWRSNTTTPPDKAAGE